MAFWGKFNLCALFAAVLFAANGCSPMDSGQSDEEKEPHYVLGISKFNEMDWPGAIDEFEQSLEVNPHSAMAHYRLAQLFDDKQPDPAAAIYHYQQYLKLEPDAKNRDIILQRIDSCKRQLAADVLQLPGTPGMQKQLDALIDQNRKLQAQVDQLNGVIRQWNVYYASEQAAKANSANAANSAPAQNNLPNSSDLSAVSQTPDDVTMLAGQSPPSARTKAKTKTKTATAKFVKSRTHVVARGETMAAIARKYKISLAALRAANPGVTPRKLRAGQTLNIP